MVVGMIISCMTCFTLTILGPVNGLTIARASSHSRKIGVLYALEPVFPDFRQSIL